MYSRTIAAGVVLALVGSEAAFAAAKLELAESGFSFGEVKEGTKLAHAFELANSGDAPLTLRFSGANAPGIAARAKREVAPGETTTIAIEWDAKGLQGDFDAEIDYATNDPARPVLALALRAHFFRPVAVEPIAAAFFSLWRGESGEQRLKVVVRGDPPAKIVKLTPEGTHFTSTVETVTDGREYALIVRVPAIAEPGRFREQLTLETDHPETPRVRVAVNVLVKPEVFVGADEISFGELDPKLLRTRADLVELLIQSFVVRRKEGPFEIRSIESDLPALTFVRDPASGPADAFRIEVGIAPEKLTAGPLAGSIRIRTSDPRFPELIVPVKGSVGSG